MDYPEIKSTRPWRIVFIPKFKFLGATGKLSSYWQPAWEGAQKAGSDFGITVKLATSDVRGDTDSDYIEPQIRLIADVMKHGAVDGLIIAPFDSNRLAPVVDKAIASGIPTIALDTPINSDRVLTLVTCDNYNAGQVMGTWVVRQLGGKGKALMLDGPKEQQNAVERRKGFFAGLQTGNVEILNTKSADWEIEPARNITEAWLKKYADVNAIIAANDNMALGAAQAVAAANRSGILITGFDATDAALSAIKKGQMSATIDQLPGEQAHLATLLLVRHLEKHEKFPANVSPANISLVTKENVGSYLSLRGLQ